jgi:hypothetical protein
MATKRQTDDPGLQQIADLERRMVLAFDERMHFHGIAPEPRPTNGRAVAVAQAAAVAAQMRVEYRARTEAR